MSRHEDRPEYASPRPTHNPPPRKVPGRRATLGYDHPLVCGIGATANGGFAERRNTIVLKGAAMGEAAVIIARILAALLIGSLIGLERSFHGRPAGFRTHALVSIASTLLMLVTVYQA